MKIKVSPVKIKKNPINQVTSPHILKKNQRRVSNNYKYDDKGLFSRKIFGRIDHCECGNLNEPGYCKICETRVVDRNNMPDFYIDLGVMVPKLNVDFNSDPKVRKYKDLLTFDAYIKKNDRGGWDLIKVDVDNLDIGDDDYTDDSTMIGLDAVRELYPEVDKWAERNMTDFVSVPHPVQRPNLIMENGSIKISPINKTLIELLCNIDRVEQYRCLFEEVEGRKPSDTYFMLSFYKELYDQYVKCMEEVFRLFCDGKKSFVGSDLRSHRVTGAVKGVMVNRHDVSEDVALIAPTFVQTLWPSLWHKYDGDLVKINQALIDTNALVLLNRPPTICHLSIVALKPRISALYAPGTFDDGALGQGKLYEGWDTDEIDKIGLRTIGINGLITNGIAGDFDGDTCLLIALYSRKGHKEAESMLPSKNYMNYANGTIRNGIIEDVEYIRSVPSDI